MNFRSQRRSYFGARISLSSSVRPANSQPQTTPRKTSCSVLGDRGDLIKTYLQAAPFSHLPTRLRTRCGPAQNDFPCGRQSLCPHWARSSAEKIEQVSVAHGDIQCGKGLEQQPGRNGKVWRGVPSLSCRRRFSVGRKGSRGLLKLRSQVLSFAGGKERTACKF